MDWRAYAAFVAFAIVVIVVPGPDFAVTVKNTLAGGRRRGRATALGISTSNACQGAASAAGLGAVILRSQPLFDAIRWCGVAYLLWLAVQTLRHRARASAPPGSARGFRQGFLSNITNPKVLAFYVAVLPQFVHPGTPAVVLIVFALTHAVLGLVWLFVIVGGVGYARRWLERSRVRRVLDYVTALCLTAFAGKLALERA